MFRVIHCLLSTVVGLFVTATLLLYGLSGLFPPQKKLTPQRREAMALASRQLLERMPRPTERITRLMVAPLVGDYTGEVAQHLRSTFDNEGFYNVLPPRVMERVRRELHLEPPRIEDVGEAVAIARHAGCEQLVWGAVRRLSQQGDELTVDMELGLYDAGSGRAIWKDQCLWKSSNLFRSQAASGKGAVSWVGFATGIPGMLWGVVASLLFVAGFALLMTPAINKVLERDSNQLNLFLLATLSLIDGAAVLLILNRSFYGLAWMILTLLLTLGAAWYNLWYCEFIERRR